MIHTKHICWLLLVSALFVHCSGKTSGDVHPDEFDGFPAGKIICIDPGHQEQGNPEPEPIAPGNTTTKPKVSPGTAGITTGVPEYEITLQIGLKLKKLLESKNAQVIMTREMNRVNISNAERAQIGNNARGDIMIRIHADGAADTARHGITVLVPAATYIRDSALLNRSHAAARAILDRVIAHTDAANRGIVERADLSGFNWSRIPVILLETGFMTNPREDALLNSDSYQDKIVRGIYDGLLVYFRDQGDSTDDIIAACLHGKY